MPPQKMTHSRARGELAASSLVRFLDGSPVSGHAGPEVGRGGAEQKLTQMGVGEEPTASTPFSAGQKKAAGSGSRPGPTAMDIKRKFARSGEGESKANARGSLQPPERAPLLYGRVTPPGARSISGRNVHFLDTPRRAHPARIHSRWPDSMVSVIPGGSWADRQSGGCFPQARVSGFPAYRLKSTRGPAEAACFWDRGELISRLRVCYSLTFSSWKEIAAGGYLQRCCGKW